MSATRNPSPSAVGMAAVAFAFNLAACNNNAPTSAAHPHARSMVGHNAVPAIDVTKLELGTAVNPDGTIAQPVATFKPTDTVHVAVTTQRPGHDIALKARWVFQDDSVVKDVVKTISPTDTMVTDFQLTNDAGWPAGRYRVQVFVNDQPDGFNHMVAITEYAVIP